MATYGFDENKNKIEVPPKTETGTLSSLRTTDKSSLVAAVNECFQNASDGKSKLAAAIGNGATASMTWDQLVAKTNSIKLQTKVYNSVQFTYTGNPQTEFTTTSSKVAGFAKNVCIMVQMTMGDDSRYLTFEVNGISYEGDCNIELLKSGTSVGVRVFYMAPARKINIIIVGTN
nr:MAG TPA: hypothetical protein [Caudoviricetes sp.]